MKTSQRRIIRITTEDGGVTTAVVGIYVKKIHEDKHTELVDAQRRFLQPARQRGGGGGRRRKVCARVKSQMQL